MPPSTLVRDAREVDGAGHARLGEAEPGEVGVHRVGPAAALEDGVRRHVVRDAERELDQVSQGEPLDLELLQHPAAGDALAPRRQLEQVAQPGVAARDEVEGAADEADLDHGGGREALVRATFHLGAVLEANRVVPEPAGEGRLERGDPLLEPSSGRGESGTRSRAVVTRTCSRRRREGRSPSPRQRRRRRGRTRRRPRPPARRGGRADAAP